MPRSRHSAMSRSTIAPAGVAVEVARRLVGEQKVRLVGERPRQGHALLLATRELARIVLEPMLETDLGEAGPGDGEGVAPAGELARQRHVLERGHGGNEVEGLEDDADMLAAE